MPSFSRRSFLATSFAGFAAAPLSLAAAKDAVVTTESESNGLPSTLFLTWADDPTTTMIVQWVGANNEVADSTIFYTVADDPAGNWQRQPTTTHRYAQTDLKVFRAKLASLKPGTDYLFRVGTFGKPYRFRTMPEKATDAISFISGGDVGVNEHAILNNIQAARQDPMFCVIGGDLGYDNGKNVDISLRFLKNYSRYMIARNDRLIPMIVTLGNHEVDGAYLQPREKAPFFFSLFDDMYADNSYATLDFGDYLSLVLLDTAHISPIEGAQTDWLEQTLKARVDHPNVMIVNHVPAYPSFRHYSNAEAGKPGTGSGNRTHWVPLFDKYRVPVVLEHHDHTFKRTKTLINGMEDSTGVLYLGDGSWGRLRAPKNPDELPYLRSSSHDYHLSLHRIEGSERFHLAMDENGRVMDVTRSGQRPSGAVSFSPSRLHGSYDYLPYRLV